MTNFYSLKEAIAFQPICPICKGPTALDGRFGVNTFERITWDFKTQTELIYQTDQNKVVIDLETDVVKEAAISRTNYKYVTKGLAGITTYLPAPVYYGTEYLRVGVTCDECCQYSYLLQILLDIGLRRISEIVLNSESITLDDGKGITHEIRNIYTTEKTEYSYFPGKPLTGETGSSPLEFPLIPLDLKDPYKTLERIRSLIIFS